MNTETKLSTLVRQPKIGQVNTTLTENDSSIIFVLSRLPVIHSVAYSVNGLLCAAIK
jgi:hypothetical protein